MPPRNVYLFCSVYIHVSDTISESCKCTYSIIDTDIQNGDICEVRHVQYIICLYNCVNAPRYHYLQLLFVFFLVAVNDSSLDSLNVLLHGNEVTQDNGDTNETEKYSAYVTDTLGGSARVLRADVLPGI